MFHLFHSFHLLSILISLGNWMAWAGFIFVLVGVLCVLLFGCALFFRFLFAFRFPRDPRGSNLSSHLRRMCVLTDKASPLARLC